MATPHPVESSQQSIQLPALEAKHAASPAGGQPAAEQPKGKKAKAQAAASQFPLEVRGIYSRDATRRVSVTNVTCLFS
jgi:hypothetical protein